MSGYRMHRPADRSVETPVQGDDLRDLGRQRAQGLAQPFVLEGARGGEVRPEALRVGQPVGRGTPRHREGASRDRDAGRRSLPAPFVGTLCVGDTPTIIDRARPRVPGPDPIRRTCCAIAWRITGTA